LELRTPLVAKRPAVYPECKQQLPLKSERNILLRIVDT
ncbi:MAG: hypothetical protein ACI8WW_002922, partial [Oceanospirillaceae bacterium]